MALKKDCGVDYLRFPGLESTGIVRHLFTTRLGGVSEGIYSSMNLSFSRGDKREHVTENYSRIARVLGCDPGDFVCTDQTHTVNIRKATSEDRGKGIVRAKDYQDVDGLITNTEGIVLAAYFADCVPVYFADPAVRAVGLCHSGWRGTAGRIGERMLVQMQEEFGSRPEDVWAAIGPSICGACYEVDEDVAHVFKRDFNSTVVREKDNGKYELDLWQANREILLEAGIRPEHLEVTDICTCCNPELLFSHRASRGRRGNLGAFIGLK